MMWESSVGLPMGLKTSYFCVSGGYILVKEVMQDSVTLNERAASIKKKYSNAEILAALLLITTITRSLQFSKL